ncbi:hypothetical protein DB42_BS00200 [Neochlamydia sp. EPS4]|uniref:hypothetical protein n=1 Tax=Neochlamydia sp. EPS4 TaxID=1478175 RepID=UPI0005834D9D|nr:hypothetical protein [Neochlamydia sp. EPS4]KIC73705.1 hypothetical protein DB42_BS00200 [Neochlamydia sp. EPS4]
MLKSFISWAFLFCSSFSLLAIETSCTFDTEPKTYLKIEPTQPKQHLIVHSYTLKNISSEIISDLFLSVNMDREEQKQIGMQQLEKEENFWRWWQKYQLKIAENEAYSSSLGCSINLPFRKVPASKRDLQEFYFNNHWHLIDQKHQLGYLALDNHTLVGYEEVADDPFLVLRTKASDLESKFDFSRSSMNFAHLDIFPKEFDGFEPNDVKPGMQWTNKSSTLYPQETLTFYDNGLVEQTVILAERALPSSILYLTSAYPIAQLINHTPEEIILENQKKIITSQSRYDFEVPVWTVEIRVNAPTGTLTLVGQNCEKHLWTLGSNVVNIGAKKDVGATLLTVHYDLELKKSPDVCIVNPSAHFDHTSPYFELSSLSNLTEKIWWQISTDINFDYLIPNFQRIEDFKNRVTIDKLTDTFFNSQTNYYFRVKTLQDSCWSEWSTPFKFTVDKPKPIAHPVFKKIGEKEYEISWEPSEFSDTQYHIFASNALDFTPSLYTQKQFNWIDQEQQLFDEANNWIISTPHCSIKIGSDYAFYRIIAEREGQYSTPSPLIRVYDYELAIPRTVLQISRDSLQEEARRIEFPPPYVHLLVPFHPPISKSANAPSLYPNYYVQPSHIEPNIWLQLQPFFLPENHPIKPKLDRLFSKRVTQNKESLQKAGFIQPTPMRFSKTIVTKNKNIPGFIFKFFGDDQLEINDWERCYARVAGAISIQEALNRHHINHLFVVPTKWIYPLPEAPYPLKQNNLQRKNFIVIENEIDIFSGKENNKMWKSPIINCHTLSWIYILLQELGLNDSPYNFNMPIAKDNRIAFVDTEHHHKWPVPLKKLWQFLSPPMRDFWNQLCEEKNL